MPYSRCWNTHPLDNMSPFCIVVHTVLLWSGCGTILLSLPLLLTHIAGYLHFDTLREIVVGIGEVLQLEQDVTPHNYQGNICTRKRYMGCVCIATGFPLAPTVQSNHDVCTKGLEYVPSKGILPPSLPFNKSSNTKALEWLFYYPDEIPIGVFLPAPLCQLCIYSLDFALPLHRGRSLAFVWPLGGQETRLIYRLVLPLPGSPQAYH